MKHVLTLATALFLFLSVSAQDNKAMILGTWEIKEFNYTDGSATPQNKSPFRKFKSYTPTHFIVIELDPVTNITNTSIFGTYEIKDDKYSETILNVNRESAGMIGRTFNFTINFDGNDKMVSIGSFNGMQTSEVWTRVKTPVSGSTTLDGSPVTRIGNTKNSPLYVIKLGDETIPLKSIASTQEKVSPLSIVRQEDIAAIEILKDATATELYKEDGRYGVIIISIVENKQGDVRTMLKAKGYID